MYRPNNSGLLKGGGLHRSRRRRSVVKGCVLRNGLHDIHLSDIQSIRGEIPDFDPALADLYSHRELVLLAEKILLSDPKPSTKEPVWLNSDQLLRRSKREIYTAAGTPDPEIVSGLYWRTHPNGRGVNSDELRSGGASFYRDSHGYAWKQNEKERR